MAQTKNVDLVLLIGNASARHLILTLLSKHAATAKYSVTVVDSPQEARVLMETSRYRLALVTNLGESPYEAMSAVPQERQFPVLFVTGFWSELLEATCMQKRVPHLRCPFSPDEFFAAVDGLLRMEASDP